VNRQRRRDLNEQAMLTFERRIAPRPKWRAEICNKLRLQIVDRKIDPNFCHFTYPFTESLTELLAVGHGEVLAEIAMGTRNHVHRHYLANLIGCI